jgi:murein DD-endopeptidase MepM/ murein hydrolase activator NlpD
MRFLLNNGKNICRLAMILCLSYIIMPNFNNYRQKEPEINAAQYGVGGGTHIDEVVPAADTGITTLQVSLESVEYEPVSFSKSNMLIYGSHLVQKGENISGLALKYGLNQDTLISVNDIKNTRLLQIGKVLKIPNQDGIFHNVKNGENLSSIAEKYKTDIETIKIANELFSDKVREGTDLFIPGAKFDWVKLQEINGDLFIWPVSGYITSPYGYRRSPFTDVRQFHSGLDISARTGTPILAAMSGRVTTISYDNTFGNYVVISHHSGYRTLYGHMSVVRTKNGAYVGTGERIGDVGNTGLSTGSHLHFTVYKNGVTVNPRTLMK